MVSELPLEPDVPLELDALLLLAVGLELGVDSPLVPVEVDVELDEELEAAELEAAELEAESVDDGVDADAVGVGAVVVVPVSAVVDVEGMAAISARVPATLTTATPALTAEVRFAPLRAVSGLRPALRAITLLPSLGWCGPWSVVHHPEGAL